MDGPTGVVDGACVVDDTPEGAALDAATADGVTPADVADTAEVGDVAGVASGPGVAAVAAGRADKPEPPQAGTAHNRRTADAAVVVTRAKWRVCMPVLHRGRRQGSAPIDGAPTQTGTVWASAIAAARSRPDSRR